MTTCKMPLKRQSLWLAPLLGKMRREVYLYFGSFNPPHIGHLAIAHYVISANLADELWFVVSPQNPLKSAAELAPATARVEMMQRAISSVGFEHRVRVCDIELSMPVPSYTYNTLKELKLRYPDTIFTIVMGEDNYASISKWHRCKDILAEFEIVVYPRNGVTFKDRVEASGIKVLDRVPTFNISSSLLREYIYKGVPVDIFTTREVANYIISNRLYEFKL